MSLNIIVLAKQVPDTRNVGAQAMNADGTINRSALPAIFNPDDLGALVTEARPPTAVTQAFRDVFSAREDQIKALQQAEARRNDAIPKARAESVVYISEATSFALDKRLRAEGDAERFRLESAAWKLSPEVTSYRLFIETVEKGLANRKKIVANPRANFGGYQLWLFGPQQAPFLKN